LLAETSSWCSALCRESSSGLEYRRLAAALVVPVRRCRRVRVI
jgi:hypothetical protein